MIGIIGGTGVYTLSGLADVVTQTVATPFGMPSAALQIGRLGATRVAFLARHGAQHTLLPQEINYRANIYALKALGVTHLLSFCAAGSLRAELQPGDVVVVDQFFDRTRHRCADTFFGDGLVAHVTFGDPVCASLSRAVHAAAIAAGARAQLGGTYVNMEGPAFSTRAESEYYRREVRADVIGMTNLTEAKLAREAELCFATLAFVTDYDAWHSEQDAVSVATIRTVLRSLQGMTERIVTALLEHFTPADDCACQSALRAALVTPLDAVPPATHARLQLLIGKYETATTAT